MVISRNFVYCYCSTVSIFGQRHNSIATDASYYTIGKGVGFALYKRFIHYAASLRVKRIEWAVLDWNQPAIDFYEQTGAKVFSDWRTAQMGENEISHFINQYPDADI